MMKDKLETKQLEEAKKDYELRCDALQKDLKSLLEKHRIDLVATLEYSQRGLFPKISFADMKQHYEHIAQQEESGKPTAK